MIVCSLIDNKLAWGYLSVQVSLKTRNYTLKSFAESCAPGANKPSSCHTLYTYCKAGQPEMS
jgi:hypothetical protein